MEVIYVVFLPLQRSHELLEVGKVLEGKSLCFPVLRLFTRGTLMDSAGRRRDGCLSSSVGLGKMSSKKEHLVWPGYSCGLRETGFRVSALRTFLHR